MNCDHEDAIKHLYCETEESCTDNILVVRGQIDIYLCPSCGAVRIDYGTAYLCIRGEWSLPNENNLKVIES